MRKTLAFLFAAAFLYLALGVNFVGPLLVMFDLFLMY